MDTSWRDTARDLPERQRGTRLDGRLGTRSDSVGASATRRLVPQPRARVGALPSLPKPSAHLDGACRCHLRNEADLRCRPVSPLVFVAAERVLVRAPVGLGAVAGRYRCTGFAAAHQHAELRLRERKLHLARLGYVDAAVGDVVATAFVGVDLARRRAAAVDPSRCARALHHRRLPLHDGLSRIPLGRCDRDHRTEGLPSATAARHARTRGRLGRECVGGCPGHDRQHVDHQGRVPRVDSLLPRFLRCPQGAPVAVEGRALRRSAIPDRDDPGRPGCNRLHRSLASRRASAGAARTPGARHVAFLRAPDARTCPGSSASE